MLKVNCQCSKQKTKQKINVFETISSKVLQNMFKEDFEWDFKEYLKVDYKGNFKEDSEGDLFL